MPNSRKLQKRRTLPMRGDASAQIWAARAEYPPEEFEGVPRPRHRRDCLPGGINEARPCPFVSCKAHLALDVQPHSGYASLSLNFPDVPVEDMPETCVFDVADRDGVTLETVAALLNVSEERARQIEISALSHLGTLGEVLSLKS